MLIGVVGPIILAYAWEVAEGVLRLLAPVKVGPGRGYPSAPACIGEVVRLARPRVPGGDDVVIVVVDEYVIVYVGTLLPVIKNWGE